MAIWSLSSCSSSSSSLCYAMLCCVMLCFGMSCYVMLCCVVLWYVMLCYVMICYVMLCYAVYCYVMLCHVMSCLIMLWYSYYDMLCYVVVSDRRQSERIKSNQQIQKNNLFWMKKKTHFLSFFAKLNFPPFLLKCFTACSLATAPLAAVNVFFPCPTPKREQNILGKRINREK